MTTEELRMIISDRVKAAMDELFKDEPDMMEVRDKLCDAAQFTHFREDGTRTDQLNPVPVPVLDGPAEPPLLKTQLVGLYQTDVDILSTDETNLVRVHPLEDQEVRRLYSIWKSL